MLFLTKKELRYCIVVAGNYNAYVMTVDRLKVEKLRYILEIAVYKDMSG